MISDAKNNSATTVIDNLVVAALSARKRAYAPYSKYLVGAALLTTSGAVYSGCNVENASYPATICAERVAMTSAIAAGDRTFEAIVVATLDGASPCGICRQVMAELGPMMTVYTVDDKGDHRSCSVTDLLPAPFSGVSLPDLSKAT